VYGFDAAKRHKNSSADDKSENRDDSFSTCFVAVAVEATFNCGEADIGPFIGLCSKPEQNGEFHVKARPQRAELRVLKGLEF